MEKTEREQRQAIVDIGRLVWQKGWIAANDGNITIRLGEDRILATPTGVCKGMLGPDDLIVCDAKGRKLSGNREPTTEMGLHLVIYSLRPDIRAVVHAHPPVATGYAAAGKPLNLALLPEVVIGLGSIPVAGYGLPGTSELTDPMLPYIPNHDAILMGNHGLVCYADEVWKAFFRMEVVEHFARIALVTELLGGPKVLPRKEVDKLIAARERYGVKPVSGLAPERPLCAEDVAASRERLDRGAVIALIDQVLGSRGL